MNECSGFSLRRTVPRLVLVGFIGSAAAACSSDTMRFADNPFSNPFSGSERFEPQNTGSVPPGQAANAAPAGRVQSQPLPAPVASAPLPAPVAAPKAVAALPATTPSGPSVPAQKGWTAQGGSVVVLGAGESLKSLSNRYGVPEAAIRGANGLTGASQPASGTRIVIPVYHAAEAGAPAAAPAPIAAAPKVAAAPAPAAKPTQVAAAAPVPPAKHRLQLVKGPQAAGTSAEPVAPAKVAAAPVEAPKAAKPAAPAIVAKGPAKAAPEVAESSPLPAAAPVKSAAAPAAAPAEAETTGSLAPAASPAEASDEKAQFRWPARGRVIAGFGKSGGNDGINIALPEGTPVKAAEGGVVAYAGSELKGYGNLVLIRHADGWVSAYAHNGEIKVKRGDTVTRGQTVALSGQSGNVNSPQLHFELRKGSTPVDPMPHLAGL